MRRFFEIHIENTNACGYKCVMCPRDQQTRGLGYMSLPDFSFLLRRLGPFEGNFHLHGFGEPLLDRQLSEKIKLLKQAYPHCGAQLISTLGVRLKEGALAELAAAGLDGLGVSLYGFNREAYQRIHGFDGFELVKKNLLVLSEVIRKSPLKVILKVAQPSLASVLPLVETAESETFCAWAKGLGFAVRPWTYVHNYGEGRRYNAPREEKMCPVIEGKRRDILNITWDLNVIPCCYDFNASIRFGNLRESTLEEIFASPAYLQFVLAHKMGDLSAYPACQNCEKSDYA